MNGNLTSSGIASFDSVTNNLINVQTVASLNGAQLSILPDGSTLYAIAGTGRVPRTGVLAIATATLTETNQTQAVQPNAGLVLSKDGSTLYSLQVTNVQGSYILAELNTSTFAVTLSLPLSGLELLQDHNMLSLTPDGTQLYISDHQQTPIVTTANLSLAQVLGAASISPYLFGPQ